MDERPHSACQRSQVLLQQAQALLRLARDQEALGLLVGLRENADGPLPVTDALGLPGDIATVLQRRGDLDGALEEIQHGIAAAEGMGAKQVLIGLYEQGAAIAEQRGDLAVALDWFRSYHTMGEEALEEAERRGQALMVRLDTERLLAEGRADRERVSELARANESLIDRTSRLEQQALRDTLTGLPNRRRLDAQLLAAHTDAVTRGVPLFVAMLDVDHFKGINDRFSHVVGDAVLHRLGSLFRDHARSADLIARFGGEEFVVILAAASRTEAVGACERLRVLIETNDWSLITPGLAVTASLGVADVAAFADVATGVQRIDELLYAAKAAGRNRVAS
jgi:diguanylate cyclase (GGDEF)-like protein